MNSAAIGAMAAAIAVPIVMAFLAKAFPAKTKAPSDASLESLKPRYAKWELGLTFLYIALWAPVTAAIWVPLQKAADWNAQLLAPADYRVTPEPAFWFIPAFFLALVVAAIPATWIAKRLLGSKFNEYETYLQLKHRLDYARVNRLACWVVGWLVAIAVALGLNWYVVIRSDALVVNSLIGLTEIVYPFSDVQTIQTAPQLIAPNGNVVQRREFLVTFGSGGTWSTNALPTKLSESEKRSMVQFISDRSGTAIEEIDVFDKWVL